MSEAITAEQVLDGLRESVAAKGEDYVYVKPGSWCLYVHTDADPESFDYPLGANPRPGCIVGDYLVRQGFTSIEALARAQVSTVGNAEEMIGHLQEEGDMSQRFSKQAMSLLVAAQAHQDRRVPWGEAVEMAAEELPDFEY